MVLSVKNKIWLGTLFLFGLILITAAVSIFYTAKLKGDARNVLQDNYESLSYGASMQQQLNNFEKDYNSAIKNFETALQKQEKNITEPGEQKATSTLRSAFNKFKQSDTSKQNIKQIREQLQQILQLNMTALQRKNIAAQQSATDALTIIISLGGFVFLIAFTFIVNFPRIITKPIIQLTDAIKEIAGKNYKYRIHINNKDEFGTLANAFNNMAQRLENFEDSNLNKLMFEKSRAEAVINSLKDASIGLDKSDIILFANEQALQLLNMRNEDMIGKKAGEIAERNDLFKFLLENTSTTPFKIVVLNRENYFTKETMEVNQNDAQSKVIIIKNITSFKELDVAKTNFIATVSHELKTPLAASDFSLKLLENQRTGTLSNEQKELIDNLKQDNQRMLKILSELLNMSQLEAGKIQLTITQVNPKVIIENAIKAVETSARQKSVSIQNYASENLSNINADEDKTIWVLNNFLTNAIKYSPENNSVEISAWQKESNIIFSVKDHGKGIAQEYLPKLFDRYFKVPGTNKKGTGLGLAISKEFIEAQSGRLWVESELNTGSTFSFMLPLNT